MTYKLAKQLKDAGFSNEYTWTRYYPNSEDSAYLPAPTLSELIEACGDEFQSLHNNGDDWIVFGDEAREPRIVIQHCDTPEEAVAKLWLVLSANPKDSLTLEELQKAHSSLPNHSKKCEKKCLLEMLTQFET